MEGALDEFELLAAQLTQRGAKFGPIRVNSDRVIVAAADIAKGEASGCLEHERHDSTLMPHVFSRALPRQIVMQIPYECTITMGTARGTPAGKQLHGRWVRITPDASHPCAALCRLTVSAITQRFARRQAIRRAHTACHISP